MFGVSRSKGGGATKALVKSPWRRSPLPSLKNLYRILIGFIIFRSGRLKEKTAKENREAPRLNLLLLERKF